MKKIGDLVEEMTDTEITSSIYARFKVKEYLGFHGFTAKLDKMYVQCYLFDIHVYTI